MRDICDMSLLLILLLDYYQAGIASFCCFYFTLWKNTCELFLNHHFSVQFPWHILVDDRVAAADLVLSLETWRNLWTADPIVFSIVQPLWQVCYSFALILCLFFPPALKKFPVLFPTFVNFLGIPLIRVQHRPSYDRDQCFQVWYQGYGHGHDPCVFII